MTTCSSTQTAQLVDRNKQTLWPILKCWAITPLLTSSYYHVLHHYNYPIMPHEEIAWWNFNVPHDQQTLTCPDPLLNAGEKDKRLIGTWDADYERLNWYQVKALIGMWFDFHSPVHRHPELVTSNGRDPAPSDCHTGQSFVGQNAIHHSRPFNCR